MLDLSPTKLIIIFVVGVLLLGPKRIPQVAHQLGTAWRKVRAFQQQIDREIRQAVPDLPTSQEIVRFARSPVTMLNQLADLRDVVADGTAPPAEGTEVDSTAPATNSATTSLAADGSARLRPPDTADAGSWIAGDPQLN